MYLIPIVGSLAASFTTAAYAFQTYKTIRTRSTASLSLSAYVLLLLGTCSWTLYGLATGNLPVLVANSAIALLAVIILALKITAEPGQAD